MTDNSSAFPMPNDMLYKPSELKGFTKREWISAQLLTGLLSDPDRVNKTTDFLVVADAVRFTDLLLARLKETEQT